MSPVSEAVVFIGEGEVLLGHFVNQVSRSPFAALGVADHNLLYGGELAHPAVFNLLVARLIVFGTSPRTLFFIGAAAVHVLVFDDAGFEACVFDGFAVDELLDDESPQEIEESEEAEDDEPNPKQEIFVPSRLIGCPIRVYQAGVRIGARQAVAPAVLAQVPTLVVTHWALARADPQVNYRELIAFAHTHVPEQKEALGASEAVGVEGTCASEARTVASLDADDNVLESPVLDRGVSF